MQTFGDELPYFSELEWTILFQIAHPVRNNPYL
jgi:hypothetical protein